MRLGRCVIGERVSDPNDSGLCRFVAARVSCGTTARCNTGGVFVFIARLSHIQSHVAPYRNLPPGVKLPPVSVVRVLLQWNGFFSVPECHYVLYVLSFSV